MEAQEPKRGRRRWIIWSSIALVVVAGVVGGAILARNANGNAKKKKDEKAPPAAPVELTEVRRSDLATYLLSTTTLEARNTAVLVARRRGEIVDLKVEEGRWVERGAVLARLDETEQKLAVERAEVSLQSATREADRGKQLNTQGFLSDKEIDDLELKRRTAEVELAQARHELTQSRITAPFAGRVTSRLVHLGETVTEGKECFRLEDFDPILGRIYFPERELSRVRVGQLATVELTAYPGREFPARVSLVNPVVDASTGTFKVTLEIRDPSGSLRPGSFARVRLRTGEHADALVLPRRAMVAEDGEEYVFVAKGDTVSRVHVQVGAISGDTAQILAGLSSGDRVVTVGQGGLKQGSRIKPVKL